MEIKINLSVGLWKKLLWPIGIPLTLIPFLVEEIKDFRGATKFVTAFLGTVFGCAGVIVLGTVLLAEGFSFLTFAFWWLSVVVAWIAGEYVIRE